MKKHDGHKLYAKVVFRSVFHAPSQKFKIWDIPNVIAHGQSYEHDFVKKRDGHQLCVKSHRVEFRSVFMHRLRNSKYWPFLMY
ncbi:hypothetical protein GW17_00061300 [Ensete ventricosum]|nr:hypothetical protein GW17_00061300 [Ensete ventricosum]